MGLLFEDGDELVADALAFFFGVDDAPQAMQETLPRVDADKAVAEDRTEALRHLLRLAGA
jgi:hypothetical protein